MALIQVEIWVLSGNVPLRTAVLATVLTPVVAGPIAFRNVWPFWAYLVSGLGVVAIASVGYPSDVYPWASLITLYSAASRERRAPALVALGTALAGVAYYFFKFPVGEGLIGALFIGLLWFLGWIAGRAAASRRRQAALEAQRDISQALARLEAKRTELAREMHDFVGHTVNVMVVHAAAGRRSGDQAQMERSLDTIETTGRHALEELDRLLGLLRDDGADHARAPGLRELGRLADSYAGSGFQADVRVDGNVTKVPERVSATAYRIVQESMTNSMKHSGADSATAHVVVQPDAVVISVFDEGTGAAGAGAGRGLSGMLERVTALGGSLELHDGADGYRVDARLPFGSSP